MGEDLGVRPIVLHHVRNQLQRRAARTVLHGVVPIVEVPPISFLAAGGRQADGRSWQIGIVRPLHPDAAIATPSLAEGAVTTSGGYERFVEIEGRRYSQLINPGAGHRAGSFTRCYGRSMACQPVVLIPSDTQSHSDWPEVRDSKVMSISQRSLSSYSRTRSAVFAPVFTYV